MARRLKTRHTVTRFVYKRALEAVALFLGFISLTASAQEWAPEQLSFFESKIRPVFIDHCYKCHGGTPSDIKSDLNLTYREGIRSHPSGTVVVPGEPASSRILSALGYKNPDLQMPPTGKLSAEIVRDFEAWIAMGAPDPRDSPASAESLSEETSWTVTLERRKKWWSFRPVSSPALPEVDDSVWSKNPVDRFIKRRLAEANIEPAPLADPYTMIRRLSYVTIGLPPSQAEITQFVAEAAVDQQSAVEKATERLLASPRFGERWARHWMDWVRYADSHGSEGDPLIPFAWRYRDYLIRALNEDVPYDDLVTEHIAGDLLPNPRVNEELELLESPIGAAQYRFVLHGFGPTDALAEQVSFTDNQIDVLSKAFMATTVSCARCHDHKFEPISQRDFYALYGVMASCRPATVTVDTPERLAYNKEVLSQQKMRIKAELAGLWEAEIDGVKGALTNPNESWAKAMANATTLHEPLHPWQRLGKASGRAFARGWRDLESQWRASKESLKKRRETNYPLAWNLGTKDAASWLRHGNGVETDRAAAGEFAISSDGDDIVGGIYPAGVYSHALSTKHSGVFSSPRFELRDKHIYLRVTGDGEALARYVIQNYPREGTVYPILRFNGEGSRWQRWDMTYWQGDMAYIELSTAMDQAVLAKTNNTRSWFGITEAIIVSEGQTPPKDEMAEFLAPLFDSSGKVENVEQLANRYERSLRACVSAWRDDTLTDAQARYLNYFVRNNLLTNTLGVMTELDTLVQTYRALEAEVPVPTRVPGVIEGAPFNQPLYTRGDHRQPSEPVPRRFLEAINSTPFSASNAGRLELAQRIVSEDNPLTARVIANRLWHHVFGEGLVTTPDNFGAMGKAPSHPELLDYLAEHMKSKGWSTKAMIRLLITSRTFQLASEPSLKARGEDPENTLLSHANVRRLEGEAIRDSLLLAAGRLNLEPPDKSVDGESNYRSVYVRVIRNRLDPLLTLFDVPTPTSTKGRRDTTNGPAHALTLMNDPFIRTLAEAFAARVEDDTTLTDDEARINEMFRITTGRAPSISEQALLSGYLETARSRPPGIVHDESLQIRIEELKGSLATLDAEMEIRLMAEQAKDSSLAELSKQRRHRKVNPERLKRLADLKARLTYAESLAGESRPWVELAHSLFNAKEFLYLR